MVTHCKPYILASKLGNRGMFDEAGMRWNGSRTTLTGHVIAHYSFIDVYIGSGSCHFWFKRDICFTRRGSDLYMIIHRFAIGSGERWRISERWTKDVLLDNTAKNWTRMIFTCIRDIIAIIRGLVLTAFCLHPLEPTIENK